MTSALLLIDFINDLEFEGAEAFLGPALEAARGTAALKARAVEANVPVIYVNDHFGQWRSDFRQVVDHVMHSRGMPIAELLMPGSDDYFVLKPRHSGFFETPLALLLESLGVKKLILTGLAADVCILFTANDAYLRGYQIVVPEDCVASEDEQRKRAALRHMQVVLKGATTPSREIAIKGGRSR